jgi:hypothetical protein
LWEHTRLVSIPREDLRFDDICRRVVLLSVWERPMWTSVIYQSTPTTPADDMLMTSDGVVAGSTLPGDKLVGICRIPLSSLSRGMPVLDGWYNVYDRGQVASGQLRVRIAPDFEIEEGTIEGPIFISSSLPSTSEESYGYKETANTDTTIPTIRSSTIAAAPTSSSPSSLSASLSTLRDVVRDLDQVQHRLRTNLRTNVGVSMATTSNPGGTVDASSTNYYSTLTLPSSNNVPTSLSSLLPPHVRVTTSISNSPSNWLVPQRSGAGVVPPRKRLVSGASE